MRRSGSAERSVS
uniref:Uncharacterized protein n=1 Tax=Arundo donax TaxID=35708 RepID=A0A0A9EIJ8_ARUDO